MEDVVYELLATTEVRDKLAAGSATARSGSCLSHANSSRGARSSRTVLSARSPTRSPAHAETASDRTESAEAARRYLSETFEQVRDRAIRAGVDVEQVVLEGDDPAAVLLEHCHQHGFDLIVVGHHHSGRAGRLLLHGIARQMIEAAEVPVLVVGDPAS